MKKYLKLISCLSLITLITCGCGDNNTNNISSNVDNRYNTVHTRNTTRADESRYNEMNPADYYKEMKSENLEYSDIAWHAKNTYGWDCSEIVKMGEPISTNGRELRSADLISSIKGTYQVAYCSSGLELRVYPRYNTYPVITNINGGFD